MREEYVKLLNESLKQIVKKLENKVKEWAILDGYYIPTRYPNALPGSIPSKIFNRKSVDEALNLANDIINFVKKFIVKEQK